MIEDVNKIQKKCDDLAENKFAQEIKLCEDIQTHIQANEQLRRKHKENTDKLLQQLKRKEKENESLLKKVQKLDKKLKDADELAGKYRKKSEENERQYNQNLAQIQNDHASQLQRTKQEAEEREQKIMQAASERESSLVTEYDTREKGLMVEYRQAASLRSHEFEERERDTEKALAKKTQDYVQLMDQKNAVEDELMMEIKRNQLKIDGLERDLRFKASEFKSIASSLESKEKTIRELKEQLEYAVDTNLKLKDVVTEGEREMGDLEKKARLKEMSLKQQVEEVSTQGKNNVANLKQENELFAQRVQSFESEVDGLQQQLFETRNSLHEAQKEKAMQGTRIKQIEHDNETLRIQFKELEVQQERDRESFEERLKKETDALKTRETNATSQLRDVKKEESRRIVNFHNMERTIEQNKFALKNYLKKEEQLRQQLEQKDAEIERLKTTQTRKEADMNSMVDCRIQRETELARDLDQALEDYQRTTEQLRRREEELKHIEARAYLADQAEEWKIEVEELRERNAVRSSNAEIAKRFLRQQEPWIGVEVVETLFEGYRRKVVVKSVAPNSPALHLGICPGDIVESMNDRHIRKTEELGRVLSKCSVGDTCTLQLLQQGKHKRTIAGLHISSQNICYEDILLLRRIAKLENDDDRTFMNKFKRKLDID